MIDFERSKLKIIRYVIPPIQMKISSTSKILDLSDIT